MSWHSGCSKNISRVNCLCLALSCAPIFHASFVVYSNGTPYAGLVFPRKKDKIYSTHLKLTEQGKFIRSFYACSVDSRMNRKYKSM